MPDIDTKKSDRGINMHVVTEVQHIVILADIICWITKALRNDLAKFSHYVPKMAGSLNGWPFLRLFL